MQISVNMNAKTVVNPYSTAQQVMHKAEQPIKHNTIYYALLKVYFCCNSCLQQIFEVQFPHFSLDRGFPCDPFSNIKPKNFYGRTLFCDRQGMGPNTQAYSHSAGPPEQAKVKCLARCLAQGGDPTVLF